MKVKLLKKMRERFTMEFNPNNIKRPYILTVKYKRFDNETHQQTFIEKEALFDYYREHMIILSGRIYGCYKKRRTKPNITIKHCEL
jgi:hypothetical protein